MDKHWREHREEDRQACFEERVVKQILRTIGVEISTAKAEALRRYGSSALTIMWFAEEYPMFPVKLDAEKLPWVFGIEVHQLFGRKSDRNPWLRAFTRAAARYSWDDFRREPCGLVFHAPKAEGAGSMIFRNHLGKDDPAEQICHEPRIIGRFGKPPMFWVIQSLSSFLEELGTDWYDETTIVQ